MVVAIVVVTPGGVTGSVRSEGRGRGGIGRSGERDKAVEVKVVGRSQW